MIWFPMGIFALLILMGLTFIPAPKRSPGFIFSCVMTLLSAFLVSFLYSFIKNTYPLTGSSSRILVHYLVHDHLFFFYPGAAVVLVCMLFNLKDADQVAVRAITFVFFCFFMVVAMLATLFYSKHGNWADPYFLFYLTGIRVFQCLVLALVAPFVFLKKYRLFMLPSLFLILIVPFITALVSYFYYTSHSGSALLVLEILYGLVLVSSIVLFIASRRQKA